MTTRKAFGIFLTIVLVSGCGESEKTKKPQTKNLGNFSISYSEKEPLKTLKISHVESKDNLLLSSTQSKGFLSAAKSEEDVHFLRGSFIFKDEEKQKCQNAQVSQIKKGEKEIDFRGEFKDCKLSFSIVFREHNRLRLAFEISLKGEGYNRVYLNYASEESEGFYGFGNQYSHFNLKGRNLPIWCQEQGLGRGEQPLTETLNKISKGAAGDWYTSYTCVPAYISSKKRGFFLKNTEYIEFDLRDNDKTQVRVFSNKVEGEILFGKSYFELIEGLTEYSGRMSPLPVWSQEGPIIRSHGGEDAGFKKLEELKKAGITPAAFWVEDWVGIRQTLFGSRMWWNWVVDDAIYPNWADFISKMKKQGVRILSYFNPFLVDAKSKKGVKTNLFMEAAKNNYLVKDKKGKIVLIESGGFDAALIDLSNNAAKDWKKSLLVEQMKLGVSGWMADFAEALPYHVDLASGEDSKAYHNRYPFEWAKLNRDAAKEAGVENDFLFFSRSGNLKSPSVSKLFWIGDQMVSWDANDGIKTVIPAFLSSGLSGYAIQHSDVGGYLSLNLGDIKYQRSKELFQRWMELCTFTPILRMHSTNAPEENHQYNSDKETLEHFVKFSKIFKELKDYRFELMKDAKEKGYPLIRPLFLHYPEDLNTFKIKQQFLLGAEILVAPVLDKSAVKTKLYLPKDNWKHLWSGKIYESKGEWLELDSPIGKPAVFFRNSEKGTRLSKALAKVIGL